MLNSVLFELPAPLVVVCHDAGAANLIFAWMRHQFATTPEAEAGCRLVLQGPAACLLGPEEMPAARRFMELDAALEGASAVLSGTGWASDLEHLARKAARAHGLPSAAVIDHWVNYRARFSRDGEKVLPDWIVVADAYAAAKAVRLFPEIPVREEGNLYLADMVRSIPTAPPGGDVLYLLEPLCMDWGRGRPGEFQALDYFAANLERLPGANASRIRLRPHPSEPAGKYTDWIAAHSELDVAMDENSSLGEAIAPATWVVGGETFAMVVALAAGRRVVSTLPPWAHRCRLPHAEIAHLRDLEEKN